ncbi:MAG TPA: uroporphyrinogen decarboxylase family protein [Candidatus Hydrogenedentes bacterium]|nr:uroporphyrinogen decarboxylase family protein [Candidatus Hydrogenedentota bacterium]HPG68955.1 uroporphyrinogen decarboxylase family protein [Candidatus Hydrogenedentota bacterium]
MDSRERTLRAVGREQPDRVPIDVWMSAGMKAKLKAERGIAFEAFLDAHDVDLRYIAGPEYIGPPLRTFPDGTDEDIWGVRRRTVRVETPGGAETYKEVAWSPLAEAETIEAVDAYAGWPSVDAFDFSVIEAQCDALHEQDRAVVFMGDRLNRLAQLKPGMYLRGVEQILVDMAVAPELARAVFAQIRRFYLAYAERLFEAARGKIDLLLTGDDFGSQGGPLVSEAMWLEFLEPGFRQYIELAHAYGVRVIHHTCGGVRPLIPHLIDAGLDVLQSLQPEAEGMEPRALKRDFGDRLVFHGGLSIQRTLPFGTPDDVRAEVRDRIDALAPGGGYILCTAHNLQADVPLANVDALLGAYRDLGAYGA